MAVNYLVGADMAIILKYGDAAQGTILGLSSLTMPGLERTIITVDEFRNDFARQFSGGGSYGTVDFGGNAVTGDLTGQDQLRDYLINRTKFTDARLYFDLTDFLMCDLANDTSSGMQVSRCQFGSAGKNDAIPFDGQILMNGAYAIFSIHYTGTGYTLGVAGTVAATGIGAATTGIAVGDTLIIEGATTGADDGMYLISVVADDLITCTDAAGDAVAFTAETLPSTGVCHIGRQ